MRFKGTIFLTALLIALGLYLYFVELPSDEKNRAAAIKKAKLFAFEMSEITRVRIRSATNEIELEYFPGHPANPWRIFDPVETVANERAGDEIATFLTDLKSSRLVEETPTNLKDFGLDPPDYTVIITLQRNNTEIVEVGSANLTGSDVYVRIGEGTSLYLVRAGIKDLLDKDLQDWRRQEVFPYQPSDIGQIQLLSVNGLMSLSRDELGWAMQVDRAMVNETKHFRADRNEVANLLGSIVSLRGEHFIDFGKDAKRANFAPPIMRVTLKIGAVEREGSFYVDDEKPDIVNIVASPVDPIFQVSKKQLKTLQQPFENYRDKVLLSLGFPGQIEHLEIIRPDEHFIIEKKEGLWWFENKKGGEAKQVENTLLISQVLSDLYHLRAEQFLDELDPASSEAGFVKPQVILKVKGKDDISLGEIIFGKVKGELLYAKSSGQPTPLFLLKETLSQIPQQKDLSLQ